IFTSGSTGRPKAVGIPHRGLANLMGASLEALALSRRSTVLQFSSLSFDASVFEWSTTLAAGARLIVAPRTSVIPGAGLEALCAREGVTVGTRPPTVLAAVPAGACAALETLVVAGEACGPEV